MLDNNLTIAIFENIKFAHVVFELYLYHDLKNTYASNGNQSKSWPCNQISTDQSDFSIVIVGKNHQQITEQLSIAFNRNGFPTHKVGEIKPCKLMGSIEITICINLPEIYNVHALFSIIEALYGK